ncbi:7-carboxy-7-deazaguanine synthase QueE [Roseovarius sp. EL26]|uniref:7-carboxy-7-deazaguanine synthase QueE n=1 Tax=Roseovarius sp. EL26 TaxID=2126672 RepID=UPI000EA32E9D|nr:7-carboxy-7-deazaguanine synthase QueE [Roseovarius sp. EL26]
MSEKIRVSEIFGPTIQGEGAVIGVPTVFVRTGGCDFRCSWCDSLHAVDQEYRHMWAPMSAQAVLDEVQKLANEEPLMITLSGGNPAIQPLGGLIDHGHAQGYTFGMETQGSVVKDWFAKLDMLVLSPKPPSSGMETDWDVLARCVEQEAAQTVLKIVVFDEVDFAYAREVAGRFPDLPIYLQPGNHTPPTPEDDDAEVDIEGIDERMRWLVDQVIEVKWYSARVLPQLHVMLWGNKRGI